MAGQGSKGGGSVQQPLMGAVGIQQPRFSGELDPNIVNAPGYVDPSTMPLSTTVGPSTGAPYAPMPMPKDRMSRGFEGRPMPRVSPNVDPYQAYRDHIAGEMSNVQPDTKILDPRLKDYDYGVRPGRFGINEPTQPSEPFNVNTAAAGALESAIGATEKAMTGPLNVGSYMNPYTSAVIDRTQRDIARQQQMQQNVLASEAQKAGAFGGSRHGVAQGVMAGEYGRMAGDIAASQRQSGYDAALSAAMADRAAKAGYASQLGALGQQAFTTGQEITAAQERQGLLQQMINQQLIDAAKGQYAGYTGAPAASLSAPLAALGVMPGQSTTTQSTSPGLLSYLQTIAMLPTLCWVAREVYGEDDPRWVEFRDWLVGHSPDWFFNAYDKYGAKFAKVVRKIPALKYIIRPFMDAKRKAIGYK